MKKRLGALALLAASVSLPSMVAAATDNHKPLIPPGTVKPMFTAISGLDRAVPRPGTSQLPQWKGSYTDLTKRTINFTQVGGDPATTNTTSTVTVLLIPIKFVITQGATTYTFDPKTVKLANNHNRNVVTAMKDSPLFTSDVDFSPQWGSCGSSKSCTDLGMTQYIDAFQRGTWWGNNVGTNTSYHVMLSTKSEPEQTISVSCSSGCVGNEFGVQVGLYNINTFDSKLQTFLKNISDVNPGVLPLFISYDVYLTSGGCCIGGYHSSDSGPPGGQTYAYATYVDKAGVFSQDVSAFSHEIGEWMDDPFPGSNIVNCNDNSYMEVGDPLEGLSNYGSFHYRDHKFQYNLQSLVYMPYFGAPISDSANNWYAIQDDMSHVCPGQ